MFIKESGNKNKPLLVLLHGGGVAGWMWKEQEEYFKGSWDMLIPDLPGHGQSAGENYISIENCASQILDLIREKKDGRKVAVAGLSLGAQIAVEIMCRLNDDIDAAVIQSALVIPMPFTDKLMKLFVQSSIKLVHSRKFAKLQAKQLYIPDELFESYFEDSKKITAKNLHAILHSNLTYALPQNYSKIKKPLLLLYGSREKQIMKKSGKLLASNPNAQVYSAKDIGHGFSLADPNHFNSMIETWLNSIF